MAFEFEMGDRSVEEGFRRIALEQLEGALAELASPGDESAAAVHSVRKRCKRLRGLLRLVRRSFKGFQTENVAVRDAAVVLSSLRDAAVLDATFEAIAPRLAPQTAGALRIALDQRAARLKATDDEKQAMLRAHARLAPIRDRAASWRLRHDGFKAIGRNITGIYARARRDMHLVMGGADAETFHDWRKQVKYHFHHLDLIGNAAPQMLKGQRKLADDLAERIGEHHDVAVFSDILTAEPELFAGLESMTSVEDALCQRQTELADTAMRLGRELLAEKPAAFEERVRRYWKDWRAENRDAA